MYVIGLMIKHKVCLLINVFDGELDFEIEHVNKEEQECSAYKERPDKLIPDFYTIKNRSILIHPKYQLKSQVEKRKLKLLRFNCHAIQISPTS
ncbi:hypothetical protein AQUCO_02000265v1 [Aquilegia coerulea]|uniref:Uncharacterized protein n=1 Tax=Aquilegia coerulea TaxID=218851 RepID=A0A2G5DGS9_AQUCA|nr:hypothetical protein AQUCO_02000265v1 [Aquilegia coerulea]